MPASIGLRKSESKFQLYDADNTKKGGVQLQLDLLGCLSTCGAEKPLSTDIRAIFLRRSLFW